jgi:hypothetical protein
VFQIGNPTFHIKLDRFSNCHSVLGLAANAFALNSTTYEEDRFRKRNCNPGFRPSAFVLSGSLRNRESAQGQDSFQEKISGVGEGAKRCGGIQ